jgi:ribosomal-protein-alanine N-acetyltransferase
LLDNLIKTEAGRFFVAVHAGELLGYAVATTNRGEGHVVSVAVSMTHRRRGIGTQLLSATLRSLKELGIYHVHLEVRKGNKTAISFYERMGFKRQSELKHYYPDGEDAVVLGCALN